MDNSTRPGRRLPNGGARARPYHPVQRVQRSFSKSWRILTLRGSSRPYVWHTHREFRRCTRCGRVYWKGTHWPALRDRLGEVAAAADDQEGEGAA